ncbi:MAG: hypothetical protein ACI90V_001799 [Bacillariaceae sp.]|jgi:hypothetical protein
MTATSFCTTISALAKIVYHITSNYSFISFNRQHGITLISIKSKSNINSVFINERQILHGSNSPSKFMSFGRIVSADGIVLMESVMLSLEIAPGACSIPLLNVKLKQKRRENDSALGL